MRLPSAPSLALLLLALALMVPGASIAVGVNHVESIHGDLSDDPAAPTNIVLGKGANRVIGSTSIPNGDVDFVSVTVLPGRFLIALLLEEFQGDNISFTGVQNGATWTEGTGGAINPANLLGWAHFSTGQIGTDILPAVGTGAGAQGFSGPLGPGDYTFLIQETGNVDVDYGFVFFVTPEPGALMGGALVLLAVAAASRRRA